LLSGGLRAESDMKKLLLFSLLISFNSYANSLDGKGLQCLVDSDFVETFPSYDTTPRLLWFEDGKYKSPILNGYRIDWSPSFQYIEEGTKYIKFFEPGSGDKGLGWKDMILNRETLILDKNKDSLLSYIQCNVLDSKEEIIDILNKVIEDAKKTNKI
jgi:hypothetical protein